MNTFKEVEALAKSIDEQVADDMARLDARLDELEAKLDAFDEEVIEAAKAAGTLEVISAEIGVLLFEHAALVNKKVYG